MSYSDIVFNVSVFDTTMYYSHSMDNKLKLLTEKENCFFIHYASDGFYNGSSPAPRISCIVLYNLKTDKCHTFSIADHLDNDLTNVELAESELLDDFNCFIKNLSETYFIHWNMTAKGFGFNAIKERAEELSIEFPTITEENLFDLSSYVAYIAEKKLSIKQVLWFNSLFIGDDYLDGKTEAEYFNEGKFQEILYSVELKVRGFADVVKLIQNNKLKIEPPYQNNDGLTKEERRQQALKIAEAREEMLKDMVAHNKELLKRKQEAFEEFVENYEPEVEEEHSFLFFDFAHPILSLFGNWLINKK